MEKLRLGNSEQGMPVSIEPNVLSRHTAVFGASGSGKSGAIIGIAEEAIASDLPIVLIDIKGDLMNIAVQPNPHLSAKMDVRFVTPQGGDGEQVSLLAGINDPKRRAKTLSLLLDKVGLPSDPNTSPHHAYLVAIIQTLGRKASLVDLIYGCTSDRVTHVGALNVAEFISKKQRSDLAARLNAFYTSDAMSLYRDGDSLNLDALLAPTPGKVPVVVYGVSHIVDDQDRAFAVGLLMDSIVDWMRTKGGTTAPRVLVILDECMGLLPPHPYSSPAKDPILTILKQGRAFGVGLLVASQNPKDIDYKALANCNTWLVGTLRTNHDRTRVLEGASLAGNSAENLGSVLSSLKTREFVLMQPGVVTKYTTRSTSAVLVGPMDAPTINTLFESGMVRRPSFKASYEQEYLEAQAFYDANPCQENKAILNSLRSKMEGPKKSVVAFLTQKLFS